MLPSFQTPNAEERSQALGALAGSPFMLRKSCQTIEKSFEPKQLPVVGDWLGSQFEEGQHYDQFKVYANIPAGKNNKIYILPFEQGLDTQFMKKLKDLCSVFYPGCRFIKRKTINFSKLQVEYRENLGNPQYNASQTVDKLYKVAPLDAFGAIAVTMKDLYPEGELSWVFGLANLITKRGIFSFARYDPAFYGIFEEDNADIVLLRAAKVMLHELGHMFGLKH